MIPSSLELRTNVTEAELRAFRARLGQRRGRQRGVAQGVSKGAPPVEHPTPDGDGAEYTVTRPRPLSARETYKRTLDYMMAWAHKSKQDYVDMVRVMRVTNPWMIAHLTDEQAADMLEDGARRKAEQAVKDSFRRNGREKELGIQVWQP